MFRTLIAAALVLTLAAPGLAQAPASSTLRVTVFDPSRAVIVGAQVRVVDAAGAVRTLQTGDRGEAIFEGLAPGRYTVRAESPGFEPGELTDVRVRGRNTRREMQLAIQRVAEDLVVGRDPREARTDPRGDSFATVLTPEQIAALPDDPDELEEALREIGGPGAVMRVNGFRGGRLPPKSQIQSIRFRRNIYAADTHEAGFIMVDISTKPGATSWRSSMDVGIRDDSLNARNAMAPRKGEEAQQRLGISLDGPLRKDRTSIAFNTDGITSYDSATIVAATPDGTISDVFRRPMDRVNFGARLEHTLTPSHTLRAEFQRGTTDQDNLGVGNYDLQSRGYSTTQWNQVFRLAESGSVGKRGFNELRFQALARSINATPFTTVPTVQVLNAFTDGSAQIAGGRKTTAFELADNFDYSSGRHAVRAGFLLEAARYRSDEVRNPWGTFMFSSLHTYEAGRPATFSQRVGDPLVEYSQVQFGWYVQDDIRARKDLTVSVGLRHEVQSHLDDWRNFAPRGGVLWSPFRDGRTTFRAGGGLFHEWYEAAIYEQTLRVDGVRQQDLVVSDPGYPDPFAGGGPASIPPGRIQSAPDLEMPTILQTSVGVERRVGTGGQLNVSYLNVRGWDILRGINVNAPVDGVRPDPTLGNITQIESNARSRTDMLSVNFNYNRMPSRMFVALNYTLARLRNESDGALSLPMDNGNPHGDWGPAPNDIHHRLTGLFNVPIWKRLRLGSTFRVASAPPYNITTGFDDNGDTVLNDRPAGVGRNSARGNTQVDVTARLSWTFGFGQRTQTEGGPQVQIVRAGADLPAGGPLMGVGGNERVRFELFAAFQNFLNRTNLVGFSGVMTSPFFGEATSALPGRRIELGVRIAL
ncbi:MAG: carboxypeptidase regulatory-like domain-containing protein [Vicinamibacterales bacterium]